MLAMTEPGQILGGKFQVLRTLGEGGMGVVYEVLHTITQHRRALKILRLGAGADENERVRLLREASAAGRIGNPHITETYDAGTLDSGETYVLMEILAGESLATTLKRRRRLPVGEAVDIVIQTCDALSAAHAANIVHRDIKPANLYLTYPNGEGTRPFVKVLDFGVSKFDAGADALTDLTGEGMLIGTLAYMPPEQIQGSKDVDGRADVYAIAVTLYTMIAGKRPFGGNSMANVALSIVVGQYEPIGTLRPDLPAGLSAVMERAMAAVLDQRTASAQQLADELRPFLDVVATPEDAAFADLAPFSDRASSRDGRSNAVAPQTPPSVVVPTIVNAANTPLLNPKTAHLPSPHVGPVAADVLDKPPSGSLPPPAPHAPNVRSSHPGPDDTNGPASMRKPPVVAPPSLNVVVIGGVVMALGMLAAIVFVVTRPAAPATSLGPVTASVSAHATTTTTATTTSAAAPSAETTGGTTATPPAAVSAAPSTPPTTTATAAPPATGPAKKGAGEKPVSTGKAPLHRENPY